MQLHVDSQPASFACSGGMRLAEFTKAIDSGMKEADGSRCAGKGSSEQIEVVPTELHKPNGRLRAVNSFPISVGCTRRSGSCRREGNGQGGATRTISKEVQRVVLSFPAGCNPAFAGQVITADGTGIGMYPRRTVESFNLLHVAIGCLVLDTNGRVYVHRRSAKKSVHPSRYDMYVGGLVVAGESPADAAR